MFVFLKCVDKSKRFRWWNLLPLKIFKSRNSTCVLGATARARARYSENLLIQHIS